MVDFATLKKNSGSLDRLTKELEKLNSNSNQNSDNEGYWQPDRGKDGNGFAIVRFLPAPAVDGDEGLPWVQMFSYGFKGPTGKWYIEKSLSTIGEKDPVGELNSFLWNQSSDDKSPGRMQARAQKRKLRYISLVKVIQDREHPENNGKIFKYRYGKKIHSKILRAMNPEFGEEPFDPFDFWTGANFRIKVRTQDNYPNYDESTFDAPSKLSEDDAELEALWKSLPSLKDIVSRDKFKSYDELKARLNEVLEIGRVPTASTASKAKQQSKPVYEEEDDDVPFDMGTSDSGDDEMDLSDFNSLADD